MLSHKKKVSNDYDNKKQKEKKTWKSVFFVKLKGEKNDAQKHLTLFLPCFSFESNNSVKVKEPDD
jgi:hypothetical protein